jgi:hypothetical protein
MKTQDKMYRKSRGGCAVKSQHINPFLEDIAKFLSSRTFIISAREETFPGSEEHDQFSPPHQFILDSSAVDPV